MEVEIFLTFCLQIPGLFILPAKPGLGVEINKTVFDQDFYKPRDLYHFDLVREIVLNITSRPLE